MLIYSEFQAYKHTSDYRVWFMLSQLKGGCLSWVCIPYWGHVYNDSSNKLIVQSLLHILCLIS